MLWRGSLGSGIMDLDSGQQAMGSGSEILGPALTAKANILIWDQKTILESWIKNGSASETMLRSSQYIYKKSFMVV